MSVAPLALPSPEHELTDPMRGVTATIPGSHPEDFADAPLKSPKSTRKTRLSSFWQGTQDVEDRLPTIEASPPDTEGRPASASGGAAQKAAPAQVHTHYGTTSFVPATAPVQLNGGGEAEDYFGARDPSSGGSDRPGSSLFVGTEPEVPHRTSGPPLDYEPATVPALPRRICLTRQTSAPLPRLALYERRLRSARPASESAVLTQAGRAAKEEQMFGELGYLTPPNPPDELERRRALYK